MILNASSVSDLPGIAKQIVSHAGNTRIFLFYGDMGAGKTTLIKQLCNELDSSDNITSPTFSIVNEYAGPNKIYHFDFYRLKNQNEALDLGAEEYFYSGNYCFIEWPEKIPDLLPDNYIRVTIAQQADNSRNITVDKV
ncbi:MAG: tRNA (adenosine(37)-N6)-threonylcarbamoyltransferase complex ATPase subunit type 1 TsaE [Sphingobacteriaceae bacterium]|nr:MAG: tRNA (adenosine(37)-N6)-threonylcarbamoyltransferase complex ATPase subunit type 1 TsaE [Sphingobacteriaceae bacterium]